MSKLGFADIAEFLKSALWLRFRSSTTFIKFGLVGASGVIVNLGAFSLLLLLGINKYIASPIAIELSIIWNFFLNNYWTFRWRKTRDGLQAKGLKFNAVSFASLGVSYGTFVALSMVFPKVSPYWHQLAGIVPAALINYFLNSYWTFRHRPRPQQGMSCNSATAQAVVRSRPGAAGRAPTARRRGLSSLDTAVVRLRRPRQRRFVRRVGLEGATGPAQQSGRGCPAGYNLTSSGCRIMVIT